MTDCGRYLLKNKWKFMRKGTSNQNKVMETLQSVAQNI